MKAKRRFRVPFVSAALLLSAVMFSAGCGPFTFLQEIPNAVGSGEQEVYEQVQDDKKTRYQNYAQPENFTQEAARAVGQLKPYVQPDMIPDRYEQVSAESLPDNPYQIYCEDPDYYTYMTGEFLNAYFNYYMYMNDAFTVYTSEYCMNYVEQISQEQIAGDIEEYAMDVNCVIEVPDAEHSFYTRFGTVGKGNKIYAQLTLHVKRVEERVFELVGVADTQAARDALGLTDDYVKPDPVSAAECRYRISEDTLQVTYDGGSSWIAVPVPPDKLFDGQAVKKSLPRGRAYVSREATAFIYGDSVYDTWIIVSPDMGVSWQKKKVASGQPGFVGFTPDGFGYCTIAVDAACGSRYFAMYVSEDYGSTWQERPLLYSMNLMDCFFLSDQIGFYTTRSSQEPSLYRTQDGGMTWSAVSLPVVDYCTMAYGPEWQDGVLVLYANEDGYAPMEGEMAKFVSRDEGVTWEAAGKVRRQATSG